MAALGVGSSSGLGKHATQHKHSGSDEVATATAAANAIPKADAGGQLDSAWIPAVGGPPTGAASGDLADTYPGPTVAKASKSFKLAGIISPTTASVADFDPAGLADASIIRVTGSSSPTTIRGLAGGADGRVILIVNVGTNTVSLTDEDTLATAGNRFTTPNTIGGSVSLTQKQWALLFYDSVSSRWRIMQLAYEFSASAPGVRALGTTSTKACAGDDARLSDARTPTAHSASHKNGGADEVATATAAANAIPKAGADGKLDAGWLPAAASSLYDSVADSTAARGAIWELVRWSGVAGSLAKGQFYGGSVSPTSGSYTPFGTNADALTAGDVVELTGWFTPGDFTVLDANQLLAVGLTDDGVVGATKTGTNRRINIGVDSAGDIFAVCADGTTATSTDTTANAVNGTPFHFKITWTVGTSAIILINGGSSTTLNTNLPSRANGCHAGVGADVGAGQRDLSLWGCVFRMDPA